MGSITRATAREPLSRSDRAIAADRAVAAALGDVTRVHRQRQHAVGWVVGVAALALCGGFVTYLLVLTKSVFWQIPVFVVCLTACAAWLTTLFGPVAGGRQFFVAAERGVLRWTAGAADHDVLRYDRIAVREAPRRTYRITRTDPDTDGTPEIVLPAMSARPALLAAIERGRPGTAGIVAPAAAALGAIVLAAATAWSGTPLLEDIVIGPPVTGDDLAGICTDGAGLGRAAAYEGAGPHPTVLTSEVAPGEPPSEEHLYLNHPDFTLPDTMDTTSDAIHNDVQLVACLRLVKQSDNTPLQECAYEGNNHDNLYQGHYQLDVIEAHSGRMVTSTKVDGTTHVGDCSKITLRSHGNDGTESDAFTSPDDATYRRALGPLYTGPSR
jgi:hypothetical protein